MFDDLMFEDWAEGIGNFPGNSMSSEVYPNPVLDYFDLIYPNPEFTGFHLVIFNSSGEIVFKSLNNSGKISLDKEDIGGSGTYFYRIHNDDFSRYSSGKILIQ